MEDRLKRDFDPTTFIDREFEQELFENLLAFQDDARILTIGDRSGMGKSRLLQMFRYRCRTSRPRIPVSLVDLRLMSNADPVMFVREIIQDLATFDVSFPGFNKADSARRSCDFDSIRFIFEQFDFAPMPKQQPIDSFSHYELGLEQLLGKLQSIHPRYHEALTYEHQLRENIQFVRTTRDNETRRSERNEVIMRLNILSQETIGQSFNTLCFSYMPVSSHFVERAMERMSLPTELTQEQEEIAHEVCIKSFFEDIQTIHRNQPMVLLIDSFEQCSAPLKTWLYDHFLESCFFDPDKRPNNLLLVVAGQQMPQFEHYWIPEECTSIVRSVHEMGKWDRTHVEECLRVHGFAFTPEDVDSFFHLVNIGTSPSQIVQIIMSLVGQGRAA